MSTGSPNVDNGLVRLVISRSIRDVFARFCDPFKENKQRHHETNMADSKHVCGVYIQVLFCIVIEWVRGEQTTK